MADTPAASTRRRPVDTESGPTNHGRTIHRRRTTVLRPQRRDRDGRPRPEGVVAVDLDTLSRGDRVVVDPESEHRDEQEARVLKLPPEEHRVPGGTEELDGEALVEYPNTTGGAMGGLLGDMQEVVDADEIVRKA